MAFSYAGPDMPTDKNPVAVIRLSIAFVFVSKIHGPFGVSIHKYYYSW